MNEPSRGDLKRLKSLQSMTEKIISGLSGLTNTTQEFLRAEFVGETSIHLRSIEQNLRETIELLKDKKEAEITLQKLNRQKRHEN